MISLRRAKVLLGCLALATPLLAYPEPKYKHYVPSKWNTVGWGIYGSDIAPVIRVKPGEVVKIDISNPFGINRANPRKFFADNKISEDLPIVQEMLEILEKTPYDPTGLRGALLTGPVFVEGAEPGDTLEVRIHDVRLRAPWGAISTSRAGSHPLGDLVPRPWSKIMRIDMEREVGIFEEGKIELPLAPFMGQMGVAPPQSAGRFGAGPPTATHGGNFDLQELTRGATLYLPVNVNGALFFTGNGHAAQGNGEISGPGFETSLCGYFEFIVHKKKPLKTPWVETPTHYIFLGMHDSLDDCVRQATLQAVEFLQQKEKLDFYDAYAVSSASLDLAVSRALVPMQMAFAYLPKHLFANKPDYWFKGAMPVKY
ncbi:MAG: acetamidase/formamidase family protein [Verrucomicrobiota bacterium]